MNTKREISIFECIWCVIENWRKLFLSAILFALLFGVLQYIKAYQEAQDKDLDVIVSPMTISDIEKRTDMLANPERRNVKIAMNFVDAIKNNNDYINNACIMKLNPYNVKRAVLQYSITSEKDISELSLIYKYYILSETSRNDIANSSDGKLTSADVNDMITVSKKDESIENNVNNNINIKTDQTDSPELFFIIIRGFSDEDIYGMTNEIKKIINDCNEKIRVKDISHNLTLINESYVSGQDEEIINKQNVVYTNLYNLYDRNTKLTETMTEDGKKIILDYQNIVADDVVNESDDSDNNDSLHGGINKKWILLGLIFGLFFMCILEVLWWLDGGRLNYANELSHDFNIHVLGKIENKTKHRFFSFVDSWIYKIKNINKRIVTKEEQFQMIFTRILVRLKKNNIEKVYLIGTNIGELSHNKFVIQLVQELKSKNVQLIIGNNIEYDFHAYEKMLDVKNVILWENTKVSRYQEISDEIEICMEQDINILGAIVVEN